MYRGRWLIAMENSAAALFSLTECAGKPCIYKIAQIYLPTVPIFSPLFFSLSVPPVST